MSVANLSCNLATDSYYLRLLEMVWHIFITIFKILILLRIISRVSRKWGRPWPGTDQSMFALHWADGASATMVKLKWLQVCLLKLSCLFFLIKPILLMFPNLFFVPCFFLDWINKDWEREAMTWGCTPCNEWHNSTNILYVI